MRELITHGGDTSHWDEVFGSAIVLGKDDEVVCIRRREPTAEEIDNPEIWVIDVGRQFDPQKRNYDHHQREMIESGDSTISLLLKEWGLWELAIEIYPSIETSVLIDAKGGNYVLEKWDLKPHVIPLFNSFGIVFLLDKFKSYDVITHDDPFFQLLKEMGKHFLTSLDEYVQIKEDIEKNVVIRRLNRVPVMIYLGEWKNKNLIYHILSKMKVEKWGKGGISVVKTDRPPNSLGVHRYDDDRNVDFTRMPKNTEGVHYIHPSGFYMVVEPSCEDELIEMIKVGI